MSTLRSASLVDEGSQRRLVGKDSLPSRRLRCRDFLHFLAIALDGEYSHSVGLHPVLMNASPTFSDVSMDGKSFDVRKVPTTSFPHGLGDATFENRKFVIVKQPKADQSQAERKMSLDEIAVELQILRLPRVKQHPNLLDLLGIVYYNTADDNDRPCVVPGIVVECAELGDLRSFLAMGYGRSLQDKFEICRDVARGLDQLHRCGIVHCDVKDSNMLVCADKTRKFVVKVSDFGFAISTEDQELQLAGFTPFWKLQKFMELFAAPFSRSLTSIHMAS